MAVDNLDPLGGARVRSRSGGTAFLRRASRRRLQRRRRRRRCWSSAAHAQRPAAGRGRTASRRRKPSIERTLADTIAIGPLEEPFAGPHFFFAVGFAPEAAAGAPFGALKLFVPRWQVARRGDSTVAVANFVITADAPVEQLTARVWKAHAKFGAFDYSRAKTKDRPSAPKRAEEVAGWWFVSAWSRRRSPWKLPGRLREGRAGAGAEVHHRREPASDGACWNHLRQPLPGYSFVLDRQRPK